VVAEWDRATRSMFDGIHLIERISARGGLIKVLDKPHLDLTTPLGRGFIAFLSAMAEDERQRIVKRANDGRKFARANGVQFGRMPKLSAHQHTEALRRLDAGESCRSIAKTMGVHYQTISKLRGSNYGQRGSNKGSASHRWGIVRPRGLEGDRRGLRCRLGRSLQ